MTRKATTNRQANAIARKQLEIREMHWPDAGPHLWNRRAHRGFATIPKTMPVILKAMDGMTNGAPVSSTYMALWRRTWDNSFVTLHRTEEMANASGFGGQRAAHTWTTRIKALWKPRFIDVAAGKSGPMGSAIIWNPHLVLRWHHLKGTPGLTTANFNALVETAHDVGARDMIEGEVPDFAALSNGGAE